LFTIPQPDGCLSATDVKELAKDLVGQLPLPGSRGEPSIPGEIWAVVTLAAVNQTSVWKTCKDNDNGPCDDTAMDWLHITTTQDPIVRFAFVIVGVLAGEPLARASLGGRRPPTAGWARPDRRVHVQNLL